MSALYRVRKLQRSSRKSEGQILKGEKLVGQI